MASIYGFQLKNGKVATPTKFINGNSSVQIGDQSFFTADLNPTLRRFNEFWELMETVKKHGYLRSAMSVVGRSAVGAWWAFRKHPEYGDNAPELHRKKLFKFYMNSDKSWNNIKDFYNFAYKLLIGVMYLRYFGQTAYQIVRDENKNPVSLDHLTGLVIPNVDSEGYFKKGKPAFVQYPTSDPSVKVEFNDPKDIVYIVNPDWTGSPLGASDIEALSTFALPIDIYLQTTAREYLKNRDKPEVIYSLPADISDEGFDAFVKEVETRWRGPKNAGHSPITVSGEVTVTELGKMPDSLPYQSSRKDAREETLAVTGVSGAKLGLTEEMTSANMRELRREFHETSMVPLFKFIELGLYEQVHVREFNARGWEIKFNNPDFLTAVERATVHMRYHDMRVLNPNEIRYDLGKPKRTDEYGDMFRDQLENDVQSDNQQGSPPEGRPVEPDAPSQTGEPTNDDQDPPRGDNHDDEPRNRVIRGIRNSLTPDQASLASKELRQWKTFAVKRMKRNKRLREFRTEYIEQELKDMLQGYVDKVVTPEELSFMFDDVISMFEEAVEYGWG